MQKMFRLKAHAVSALGGRKTNEDAYLVNEDIGLFIVADGMGGHDKGEVASWFTVENLADVVAAAEADAAHTVDPVTGCCEMPDHDELLEQAILRINRRLFEENEREVAGLSAQAAPGFLEAGLVAAALRRKRMGTTLASLLAIGGHAHVTHIGDSRVYRIAAGQIRQLTQDHSWIEERIHDGTIAPEEARAHQKRNVITRSVGFKRDVEVDIDVITLRPPERFLLCSDGLSNMVKEDDLLEFGPLPDLERACEELVDLALVRGGRDNITAVLVDVSKPANPEEEKARPPEHHEITEL